MVGKILDPTIGALDASLNLRQMNQSVISSNIANADTPGYKAKAMEFETAFRDALGVGGSLPMAASDPQHIARSVTDPADPEIYDEPNGVESLDGNTVNRAEQMVRLQENQLMYDASVEMLKKKLGMLRYSVTEGGGNH